MIIFFCSIADDAAAVEGDFSGTRLDNCLICNFVGIAVQFVVFMKFL